MNTPLTEAHEALLQALARYGQEVQNTPQEARPSFFALVTHPTNPNADADLLLCGKISVVAQGVANAAGLRSEVDLLVQQIIVKYADE